MTPHTTRLVVALRVWPKDLGSGTQSVSITTLRKHTRLIGIGVSEKTRELPHLLLSSIVPKTLANAAPHRRRHKAISTGRQLTKSPLFENDKIVYIENPGVSMYCRDDRGQQHCHIWGQHGLISTAPMDLPSVTRDWRSQQQQTLLDSTSPKICKCSMDNMIKL